MAIRGLLDAVLEMLSLDINWNTMKNTRTTMTASALPLGKREFRYEAIDSSKQIPRLHGLVEERFPRFNPRGRKRS